MLKQYDFHENDPQYRHRVVAVLATDDPGRLFLLRGYLTAGEVAEGSVPAPELLKRARDGIFINAEAFGRLSDRAGTIHLRCIEVAQIRDVGLPQVNPPDVILEEGAAFLVDEFKNIHFQIAEQEAEFEPA